MNKRSDFFTRKLKYTFPSRRKINFLFQDKKYESSLGYNEKIKYHDLIQSFFKDNYKKLKAENFEVIRQNRYIPKGNYIDESCLKKPFKIIPMEITKDEFLYKNNYPIHTVNYGFALGGRYEDEKKLHCNFFNYLSLKIDPKKYEISNDILNQEHIIKTTFNTGVSNLLEKNFYKKMENTPNSGFDKVGKFIVGVFDKEYYKQFSANLISHMLEKNNSNNKLTVDIDYLLKGLYTPEYNVDLMIRNPDDSFMFPVTFTNHLNEIKNYKKFLEEYFCIQHPICESNEAKNKKQIIPNVDIRIQKLGRKSLADAVNENQLMNAFEEFEDHSFKNYNLLRVKSKFRTQTGKRLHFGASLLNDKFRFQLFVNHPDHRMLDVFSLIKSKTYSFDIDPNTNKIHNPFAIKEFLKFINIINNVSDEELYYHYLNFQKHFQNAYFPDEVQEKLTFKVIKNKFIEKFNPKPEKDNEFIRICNLKEKNLLETLVEKEN